MKKSIKIAITGGIGSGKSLATSVAKSMGYACFSCDQIASELYTERKFLKKLKKIFPTCVSGRIKLVADKKQISQIVFTDKQKLKELNDLTHPLIYEEILSRAEKAGGITFLEIPLLFESGYQDRFDGVIILMRPLKNRVESIKTRSNLTETEIAERIGNQIDYCSLNKSPYTVVGNCGNLEEFRKSVKRAISKMIKNIQNK